MFIVPGQGSLDYQNSIDADLKFSKLFEELEQN